jgi:hypothetical protein
MVLMSKGRDLRISCKVYQVKISLLKPCLDNTELAALSNNVHSVASLCPPIHLPESRYNV